MIVMSCQCSRSQDSHGEAHTGVPRKLAHGQASKLMTLMPRAVSDLSGHIIIIYKMWGKSERPWGKRA